MALGSSGADAKLRDGITMKRCRGHATADVCSSCFAGASRRYVMADGVPHPLSRAATVHSRQKLSGCEFAACDVGSAMTQRQREVCVLRQRDQRRGPRDQASISTASCGSDGHTSLMSFALTNWSTPPGMTSDARVHHGQVPSSGEKAQRKASVVSWGYRILTGIR